MSENGKSLISMVNEANAIEQLLIQNEGVTTDEISAALTVIASQLPSKIDSYNFIIDRMDSLEDHYKEQAAFFTQIAKQCGNAKDRLKENIKFAMKALNTDEVQGHNIRFKLQRVKPKLVVENESLIPKEYQRVVTTTSLDKERIKEDLAIGPIAGCKLEESFSLKTYAASPSKKGKNDE